MSIVQLGTSCTMLKWQNSGLSVQLVLKGPPKPSSVVFTGQRDELVLQVVPGAEGAPKARRAQEKKND